jgi:hypothetical protein
MTAHIEWSNAAYSRAEVYGPGSEIGEDTVAAGHLGLLIGDGDNVHVIEGTADELHAIAERITAAIAAPAIWPIHDDDDDPAELLARVRELLTETDWSGVLYDNDVLGAIAEAVGVERQD